MKINELIIIEHQEQIDEISLSGVGKAIGKGASVAGKTIGGAAGGAVQAGKNFWQGMKAGYAGAQQAVAGDGTPAAQPTPAAQQAAPAGGSGAPAGGAPAQQAAPAGGAPAQQAAPAGGAPAAQQAAPPASSSELDQIKATVGKLNPEQKKELAGELEKSMNAPAAQQAPADPNKQSADATARGQQNQGFGFNRDTGVAFKSQAEKDAYNASKQQTATNEPAQQTAPAGGTAPAMTQQEKNAADAAERDKQIAATKAANAAAAQADNELVAAVKAAKAKPGFQQTAQDKLTIQKGAAKGIHESKKKKKKKIVAEFKSNFLGITI